jgi:hypothetical protein
MEHRQPERGDRAALVALSGEHAETAGQVTISDAHGVELALEPPDGLAVGDLTQLGWASDRHWVVVPCAVATIGPDRVRVVLVADADTGAGARRAHRAERFVTLQLRVGAAPIGPATTSADATASDTLATHDATGRTLDLSTGGFSARLHPRPIAGSPFVGFLRLPDTVVVVGGEITRVGLDGRVHARFTQIDERQRDHLAAHVMRAA